MICMVRPGALISSLSQNISNIDQPISGGASEPCRPGSTLCGGSREVGLETLEQLINLRVYLQKSGLDFMAKLAESCICLFTSGHLKI